MQPLDIHHFPVASPFYLILLGSCAVLFGMVLYDVLRHAYRGMGISPRAVFAVILLSLLGSYVNIPVAQFPDARMVSGAEITNFWMHYIVPVVRHWPGSIVAVNLGGAVLPVMLSGYLLAKNHLYVRGAIGVAIVAAICHWVAYPVPGLGIVEPVFAPPLATAVVALMLSRRQSAPLAYISGSLGTLIGADLLNVDKLPGLGAPIVSIGGAGTFDAIFITGLIAVIFASIARREDTGKPTHARSTQV